MKKKVIRNEEKEQLRGQSVGWLIYRDDGVFQSNERNWDREEYCELSTEVLFKGIVRVVFLLASFYGSEFLKV